MAKRDWYCEDVLSGKIQIQPVWQDGHVLAFHHPSPRAETHVVIIPKSHVSSLLDPRAVDGTVLCSMVQAVQHSARAAGLSSKGFYVRINAGAPGVTPHMHWHILGPGAGLHWPIPE
jgi:histidine triad (HIT) family protein